MNTLFNEDIVETSQQQGPVTVLGITFASDDERRAYFREELRKKLPELKHIEGFPIGDDDDIVNLSDPPYYTACPNPWINNFIAEWEQEKTVLEQQGERTADFVVDEPYASDVSEGKNNPIYMAHAYHTKVPHPAIMRYILHYTQPGDIVFDGFAGTGMTGVAANMCKDRYSICSDLSPIASLLAANYILPTDPSFKLMAEEILSEVEAEYGWMYETMHNGVSCNINYTIWSDVFLCKNCGNEIVLFNETVDLENEQIHNDFQCKQCGFTCTKKTIDKLWITEYDENTANNISINKKIPVIINYTFGNKRYEKQLTNFDIEKISKIRTVKMSGIPTFKLPEGYNTGQPIRSNGIEYTHLFYTERNRICLNEIYKKVKNNRSLLIWFTSVLQNASKMYKFRLDRKGGIVNGTLFIPSLNIEQNVFRLLRGKINDFCKAQYNNKHKSVVGVASAIDLSIIRDNSLDYIFIDPPFGANIMYSELNLLWENWLNIKTNNKSEAIENSYQGKDAYDYQNLMTSSFSEFFRVLKPNKWITIEFSNTSAAIWNCIQTSLSKAGFLIANVSALDKKQGSFKAVTSTTAVKQDLVISCYKPSAEFDTKFTSTKHSNIGVWDFIEEHLNHLPVHIAKDNATTAIIERSPKILYDRLIAFYVQRSLPVPIDAGEFQNGLKERFLERDGMYFNSDQVIEYDEKRKGTTEFYHASLFVSSEQDGVMWLKDQLKDSSHTYQDLQPKWMQAIAGLRKGDILPELRDLLHENFLQNEDGAWYLPDMENEIDLEKVRTNRLLKQFAAYKELASKPKAKIKEVRVEALRVGFKQCYKDKDFLTIVTLAEKIPNNLLMEDEVLLQYYDIASTRVER